MSISKDKVKIGIKNQLKTILHMLIFNMITAFTIWIAYSDKKDLETSRTPGGIIPLEEWSINVYIYAICIFMFIVGYSIFWRKFLKKDLKKDIEIHWSCIVVFTILFILFLFIQFMIAIIVILLQIGLFGTISNVPEGVIEFVVLIIYQVGYLIVDMIIEKIKLKKRVKEE